MAAPLSGAIVASASVTAVAIVYDETDQPSERPNKSQLKREAEAMRELGRRIVALSPEQTAELPLTETLREAVEEWRRIRSNEARRRQIQRIGKLLREVDPAPIRTALERLDHSSALAKAELHAAERWRERLLEAGDEAVQAFVTEHPHVDTQQLRQLLRNARREQVAGKPPKAYRELFRMIRAQLQLD